MTDPKTETAPPNKPPYIPSRIDEYYDPIRNLGEQIKNLTQVDALKLQQYLTLNIGGQ